MCMFINMRKISLTHHTSFFKQKIFLLVNQFSGGGDKIDFDGNTLLLECEDNEYVYISGLEIFKFKTDDKTIDYISLMGINMIPYTFAVGEIIHISYHLITILFNTIKLKKELY